MDALLRDPCCVAGLTVVGLFAVGAIVTAAGRFVIGLSRRKEEAPSAEGEHGAS
jgi:hypothetical protein